MSDLKQNLDRLSLESNQARDKVIDYCRTIEPTLRDAGQNHTADRLAALLGELDAINARIDATFRERPGESLAYVIETLRRQRP
jgi:hypothetical protein